MIVYMDTSALVKHYVLEPGSNRVLKFWNQADAIAISVVGYAEVLATFQRKYREQSLSDDELEALISEFKDDWSMFNRVDVKMILFPIIDRLLKDYRLRGFDVIHLSSCIKLHESINDEVVFLCADHRLLEAAEREKITTVDASIDRRL